MLKLFGIVYGYYEGAVCVYVGQTVGVAHRASKVLAKRHAGHLCGDLLVDKALRQGKFTLRLLHKRVGDAFSSRSLLRKEIRGLEIDAVQNLRPAYNVSYNQGFTKTLTLPTEQAAQPPSLSLMLDLIATSTLYAPSRA